MFIPKVSSAIIALTGALTVARAGDICGGPSYTLEGYGAGATGGSGPEVVVKTCDAFREAAKKSGVIKLSGRFKYCGVIDVSSDTTITQERGTGSLDDTGIRLRNVNNVIVRGVVFQHPPQGANNILLDGATNIWIDHNEFASSGTAAPEAMFGDQISVTGSSDLVTVSWNLLMNAWGAADIGAADGETGPRITFHHNYWFFINDRAPALDSGVAHIHSNCMDAVAGSGVTLRGGASALIEKNYFVGVEQAITTSDDSSATERNNIFNQSPINITKKGHVEPPYDYSVHEDTACLCDLVGAYANAYLPSS
jgi:pectate lyase